MNLLIALQLGECDLQTLLLDVATVVETPTIPIGQPPGTYMILPTLFLTLLIFSIFFFPLVDDEGEKKECPHSLL